MDRREFIERLEDVIDLYDIAMYNYILDWYGSMNDDDFNYNKLSIFNVDYTAELTVLANYYNKEILTRFYKIIDIGKLNIKDRFIKPLLERILFSFNLVDIDDLKSGNPDILLIVEDVFIEHIVSYSDYVKMAALYDQEQIEILREQILSLTVKYAEVYEEMYKKLYNKIEADYRHISKDYNIIPIRWYNDILMVIWLGS